MLLRHPLVDPQDDRADPLARPPAVAARRAVPPPRCTRARDGEPPDEPDAGPAPASTVGAGPARRASGRADHAGAPRAGSGSAASSVVSARRAAARRSAIRRRPQRRRDAHPRSRRPSLRMLAGRRHRRGRGLHGRPVVEPGPAGAAAGGGPQPRGAGARRRLVAAARSGCSGPWRIGRGGTRPAGAGGTSRPTTTSATTSTACSSTRR